MRRKKADAIVASAATCPSCTKAECPMCQNHPLCDTHRQEIVDAAEPSFKDIFDKILQKPRPVRFSADLCESHWDKVLKEYPKRSHAKVKEAILNFVKALTTNNTPPYVGPMLVNLDIICKDIKRVAKKGA